MSRIMTSCALILGLSAGFAIKANQSNIENFFHNSGDSRPPEVTATIDTSTTLTNIGNTVTTLALPNAFSTDAITCSDQVVTVKVDERSKTPKDSNQSLLRAIRDQVAGSNIVALTPDIVYPFVQKIVTAGGHGELQSPQQLDNVPTGDYPVALGCHVNATGAVITPAP